LEGEVARLEAELAEAESLVAEFDDAAHDYFRAAGREVPGGHDFGGAALQLVRELSRSPSRRIG
jgi:hypothetical protein